MRGARGAILPQHSPSAHTDIRRVPPRKCGLFFVGSGSLSLAGKLFGLAKNINYTSIPAHDRRPRLPHNDNPKGCRSRCRRNLYHDNPKGLALSLKVNSTLWCPTCCRCQSSRRQNLPLQFVGKLFCNLSMLRHLFCIVKFFGNFNVRHLLHQFSMVPKGWSLLI